MVAAGRPQRGAGEVRCRNAADQRADWRTQCQCTSSSLCRRRVRVQQRACATLAIRCIFVPHRERRNFRPPNCGLRRKVPGKNFFARTIFDSFNFEHSLLWLWHSVTSFHRKLAFTSFHIHFPVVEARRPRTRRCQQLQARQQPHPKCAYRLKARSRVCACSR